MRFGHGLGRDAFAAWANHEANVELRSTLHRRGTLECNDRVSPNPVSLGPTLSGTFEAEQSFLSGWIFEAEAVLDDAPNRPLERRRWARRSAPSRWADC
jgi:hypothetical protein